jgi:GLPGLI family protein
MWCFSFGPKSKRMRKTLLAWSSLLLVTSLWAQQKEGTVVYERTMQMQLRINDDHAIEQMLPKTRTDKFELSFGKNQSLWKHVDEEENNDEFGGGGMQIKMVGPGQNDILFCDFNNARRVEQRELFDKKFVVEDSIRKLNWKLTSESRTLLGHPCLKAIAQRITPRMQMTIDNGKMERKEVVDTNNIVAWFASDIPVSAGPEVQGQLPGLILALDINDGRMVYKALEISSEVDLAAIKEPTKGKKVTPAQFNDERNKMMDEMQKNNQGNGSNRIIIRN